MFWRKSTSEDTTDLRHFVDGMKRGVTPATNDSLLETLRQIHDRRETPAPTNDHRQMLLERLRREMRVRAGEPVSDRLWVPTFAEPAPRRRFVEWAVAASLVAHLAAGGYVLTQRFRSEAAPAETAESRRDDIEHAIFLPLPPRVNDLRDVRQVLSTKDVASVRNSGSSRPSTMPAVPTASSVPSLSSLPVGPPVAPGGGGPIVPGFSASGLEGQFDRNIPESAGPSTKGPDEPKPFSEVGAAHAVREDPVTSDYDVPVRVLFSPKPTYPEQAFQSSVGGRVRVEVTVGADGSARDIRVSRPLGYGCDEAALDAVRRSKFAPATRGGVAVTVRIVIDVTFEIH